MPSSATVVRTYAANDWAAAERSYHRELEQAVSRGWSPISRRWRSEGREHVLVVTYEVAADAAAAGALPFEASPPTDGGASIAWSAKPSRERDARRWRAETLELHCAGEPLRLVRFGFPKVPLASMAERRAWAAEHADAVRRLLLHEPRGHRDLTGAVLLEPTEDDADIAVLFMDDVGFGPLSGHGVIALTTALIEEGLYPAAEPRTVIRCETPSGVVTATARVRAVDAGEPVVDAVRYVGAPAFLVAHGLTIRPRGVRLFGAAAERKGLNVQLAHGGATYGIVDVNELGLRVAPEHLDGLSRAGTAITSVLRRDHQPEAGAGDGVHGTIIVDSNPETSPDGLARSATIRTLTVVGDGRIDSSPNGTGASAILAARDALGGSDRTDEIVIAGITGETFRARVEGPATGVDDEAITTSVEGRAHVIGRQTFVVDERDALAEGFLLR